MAYNKINKLKQIVCVQEYALQERQRGMRVDAIYQRVATLLPFSRSTFDLYMQHNAREALTQCGVDWREVVANSELLKTLRQQ